MTSFRTAALSAASLFALGFSNAALAQDAAAPAAAPGTDQSSAQTTQGDIVVTAQRRVQNIRDVPLSVTAQSGDTVRDYQLGGSDTLLSLSGKAPSLYIESTTGRIFPRFYIRGLGNIDFYLGASQPVSIIHDDVVLEHVVMKSNPAFDVAQVEVLRGPQGSLFGRNTTAGIVKFDTVQPASVFSGQFTASAGSKGSVSFDGGVGGPLIADGKLNFRLSALLQHRDNWVDNGFQGPSDDGTRTPQVNAMGGFDERDVRLQLGSSLGALKLRLSGHYRDYAGTSTLFRRGSVIKGSDKVPATLDLGTVRYDEAMGNPQHYRTYGSSLKTDYDLGGVTMTSITAWEGLHGYSRGDTDGGAAAAFGGVGFGESQGRVRRLNQWSQEVRFANSTPGPLKWQAGVNYFDSRDLTEFDQRAFFLTNASRNPNNWVLLHNVNTLWGVFGQASYQVAPRLTLTAGARYSWDKKETQLLKAALTAAGVDNYKGRRDVKLTGKEPSWDVSALYKANDEVNFYARIARGFRGPTIQGRSAVFNADFSTANSETNTSYEAGVKTSFLGGKVKFDLTGFAYTVRNIQLNGNDSFGNGVLFNADRAIGRGIEASLALRPVEGLKLDAGLSLLHTAIHDKRVYAQVCAFGGQVVCTVLDPTVKVGSNTFAQIDGNALPQAPTYNLNLAARYDLPVGAGRAFVATDWNVQGRTSLVPYSTVEFTTRGNFEGGAKVGYATDRWEAALFARNITNEKNLIGVIENYMAGVYNDPRIIGVSLSAKFR
ncbi:TonB-dependent receptor [Sphingomonas sp. ASV193]|uniref:TonB-dependent receptor n=1 Tax=Sphingomonas sp. ASV193 TaxID=3144405 RepID=UPI0032E8A44B